MVASYRSAMESGIFQIKIKGSHSFESMNALGRNPPPNRHLKGRSEMSVYPTNLTSDHPTACQYHA